MPPAEHDTDRSNGAYSGAHDQRNHQRYHHRNHQQDAHARSGEASAPARFGGGAIQHIAVVVRFKQRAARSGRPRPRPAVSDMPDGLGWRCKFIHCACLESRGSFIRSSLRSQASWRNARSPAVPFAEAPRSDTRAQGKDDVVHTIGGLMSSTLSTPILTASVLPTLGPSFSRQPRISRIGTRCAILRELRCDRSLNRGG
jgi:hypothetical protein